MAQYIPNKTVQMAHVINLLSIAMLDGNITEEEKKLVFQIANDFGLTENEFQQCYSISQEANGQVIYEVPEDENERIALLKNLAIMMMIDGKVDANERQYLVIVAEKFGFDGEKAVDILINRINEEVSQSMNTSPETPSSETSTEETPAEMTDEQFQAEMQKRIQEGKEALTERRFVEAFKMLFVPSLVDGHAARLMLKLLAKYHRVRLIPRDLIEQLQVEEMAQKGYPIAQYILGRYHQIMKPDNDSIEKAKKWFDEAKKANIGDAFGCEAMMVLDGYYSIVDLELYKSLVLEGYDKGYSNDYCSIPLYRILYASIYGKYGVEANPQGVIDSIKQAIGSDESDDIDVVDPVYYQLLADAYVELGNKDAAIQYYTKAIDMGCIECYSSCILLSVPDEDSTHNAWEIWKKTCLDGGHYGDPFCYSLYTIYYETDFDALPEEEQHKRTEEIKNYLNDAYSYGDEFGAYLMGYNYYYGLDGFEQNIDLAWKYCSGAAYWEDGTAYGLLAQMIEEGYNSEKYDKSWANDFYLQALRRGDDNQLDKVVEIYRSGGLTEFTKEIELIYIPRYEQQLAEKPEDDNEGEYESDLKLIAIVKTDGTADIIEFDVQYWDELPPFIDAERLDAVRVQPLYDISKKLGYSEHITGWVDNMGLLRDLPSNPIGCKIYPGKIAGDMILTLEDANYTPMSFTDLDDLKQVIADLGAKLEHVFLDDGPDDDGRFDPWA